MTKPPNNALLYWVLLLLGLPLSLVVLASLAWPTSSPYRVSVLERWIEPLQTTRFDRQGFAELAQHLPDFEPAQAQTGTQWQPVKLPDVIELPASAEVNEHTPMARVWFRFRLQIPTHSTSPDQEFAVFGNRMMGGAYAVWANGRLLHANINDWPMQFNTPLYVTLPLEMTAPGQSVEVLIAMPYRLNQGYAVGSLYAGPVGTTGNARDWRVFWQKLAPQASTWVMLLVGGLSLHLWWARRQDDTNLMLALLSAALLVCNCQYFYNPMNNETLSLWYNSIVDSSVSWVLVLVFFFTLRFKRRHFPRFEAALVAFALTITVITLPVWDWQENALLLQHYFNIAGCIGMTGFVTWRSVKTSSLEEHAVTGSVWLLTLFGIHDIFTITAQTQPDEIFLFPFAALAIASAFMFISQRQHIGAIKAQEQFTTTLEISLRKRETELREKHAQLIAMENSRTLLEERQRLVRDMHDGIGSALMTSMIMAQGAQISPTQMADTLRDCLDDLKAVIDSLEPVGHDVRTLLGTLRQRLDDRIKSAGLALAWKVGDVPPLPWLHPPQALHVLRIVQEALSNVLKHARATQVEVAVAATLSATGEEGVTITITDNGRGFDASTQTTGRGLRHMQERASTLGGAVTINATPNAGARVCVWLPGPGHGASPTTSS